MVVEKKTIQKNDVWDTCLANDGFISFLIVSSVFADADFSSTPGKGYHILSKNRKPSR